MFCMLYDEQIFILFAEKLFTDKEVYSIFCVATSDTS